MRVRANEAEDVHNLSSPSMSTPTSPSPLLEEDSSRFKAFAKRIEYLYKLCAQSLDPDYKDVLDKEVHGAIMTPSPILSEGVILIEDEPPDDEPYKRVDTP